MDVPMFVSMLNKSSLKWMMPCLKNFVQNISLLFIHMSLLFYTVDCHSFLVSKPLQNSDHSIGVIQNKIENR